MDGGVACNSCKLTYTFESGIVDGMPLPSDETANELRGMMRENGLDGDISRFKRCKVERISSFEERKKHSRDMAFDYYGSTELNFRQALTHVPLTGRERVLEIGGDWDFPFLGAFRAAGCTCFETNIFFFHDDAQTPSDWPVRVLGDMHALPYRDASFDVVVISAASHHASDMPAVMRELARVTRPGGYVVNVNEPTRGLFKHLLSGNKVPKGKQDIDHRDELVHEHEYSILEYLSAFRKSGLELKASLFSDYYDQRLSAARVNGIRFAGMAKAVSAIWRLPGVRSIARGPGLWLGQATVGLQMNVVLRKRA